MKEHEVRAQQIFVEHLAVDDEQVTREAGVIDDLGADSLDEVELVMAFEEEFGIEITDDEAKKATTVGDYFDLIGSKL